ncbi:hypothetical protein BTO20_33905 [Mycobacterium dioxanotrophicus]|uniref:Uncharacterized protein n=1 Tax=Mycobacterium dioxanotrophicus TaxID=482462 RepID=A0A1Y0CCA8_9MYCO|nr:hypothetical protein BTO20_33905 [Mycobacterium dioxanotrophicus]
MTSNPVGQERKLHKGTNWWGAFVIGLAGPSWSPGSTPGRASPRRGRDTPARRHDSDRCVAVPVRRRTGRRDAAPHRRPALLHHRILRTRPPRHRHPPRRPVGLGLLAGLVSRRPINMILASAYITQLFSIPQGPSFLPFGGLGSPITLSVLIISVVAIAIMYVPAYFGIKLGAEFATILGIVSMAPLTILILLPLFHPSSIHLSNLAGFHFAPGVLGSPTLILAWMFVMTWSVLAMEAAACYLGECRNPARDAKIAMTMEGVYGFFIFVFMAVALVAVLGVAKDADPLTIFTSLITAVTGSSAAGCNGPWAYR